MVAAARAIGNGGSGTPSLSPTGVAGGANFLANPGQSAWHAREQIQHFKGWVFSAIRPIANRIAGQPIRVAKLVGRPRTKSGKAKDSEIPWHRRAKLPDGLKHLEADYGAEILTGHPILDAMDDPNALMVRWAMMYVTVVSLEMTGRAFWWIKKKPKEEWDNSRTPKWGIWPVPSHWMTPVHKGNKLYSGWEIKPDQSAKGEFIPHEEVVYFYYPDFTNPMGCFSTLQAHANSVRTDEYIVDAQTRSFQNGIHPGVILTVGRHPDVNGVPGQRPILTTAQRAQMIHYLKGFYKGTARWDEPMILDGLIDSITKMTFSPMEMDYPQSSKLTKERITQGYGVSPVIMGHLENANRAAAIVADEHFVNSTVNPKISLLSQCATVWMGPLFSTKNERLLVYIEPAETHDAELELKTTLALFDRSAIDVNFLRAKLLGLPPIDGGNVCFMNRNMVPVLIDEPSDENPYVTASRLAGPPAGAANPPGQDKTTEEPPSDASDKSKD